MLSYKCTNTCRHCLYACSPNQPNEWMSLEMAENILVALAQEPMLESIHLSGGEAALKMDLLIDVIGLARKHGVPLSYLETNGAWCLDAKRAEEGFRKMRDAGLYSVLVSASMFHNEFIPFERTQTAVQAASEVFGTQNVLVWLPNLYQALGRLGDFGETRTLEEFSEKVGLSDSPEQLPQLYSVIAAGRAARALRYCYTPRAAAHYRHAKCMRELMSTSHFHIDLHGNLFTGLCPGIAPGSVDELHPSIDKDSAPVFYTLCEGGPHALMKMATRDFDFEEAPEGYVSKCDLCQEVRRFLLGKPGYEELRPLEFYQGLKENR